MTTRMIPRQSSTSGNNPLGRNLDLPLPPSVNNIKLAEEFNLFFTDKIAKIRENLQHTREECNPVQSATYISGTCNLVIRSANEELYTS